MAIKILTDSTSYIDKDIKEELDIQTISLNIIFKNESFKECDIDNDIFYKKMEQEGIPTSSQPSIEELYHIMKDAVEKGDSILCIFLSSDLSGTYSAAHTVKNMILEKYENAKIEILDSRSTCMQLGFAAILAAKAAKEGQSLEEVKKIAEKNLKKSKFLFIPDNLEYLKKGGRIGGASALIGNLLKIIPILTVEEGKTTIYTKVRTKKKAIETMLDKLLKDANSCELVEVVIHHINCFNEAIELNKKIKEIFKLETKICDIGPVIGMHVGPGAIGIVYYTKQDII
ncbi:DegV family protein [Clostridium sp. MSJ-11]|uniref:DegV family protein n=1 Tax=Clostridium mobile TaxID=2841512 RepID=A0ABS6EEI4_9CLOT|nr:DegV family protein [Clostridium mobile]MBU5483617.1 DegV family protein [Clostridium mobile]